jgi:ATP-binding cassette, subfamily B, bacterial PglK
MLSFKKLWQHFSKRRHKQFYLLLILMSLTSLVEVVSIGAVLPFLGVFTAPESLFQHSLAQPLIELLEINSAEQMLLPVTIIFIVATVFSGVTRLLLLYVMTKLSQAVGADLSINIYRRTLYQKYAVHVQRNSSVVINGVINKTGAVVGGIITPTMTLISSTMFITAIIFTLFSIDIAVASVASIGFGGLYWIVIRLTRKRLQENSQCIAQKSTLMIKSLQEGLGGIRDVLVDGSQEFYCQLYRGADLPTRRAVANNVFIKSSPRFVMESLGMVLISGLAYSMSMRENGLDTLIPVLGALALGAQKLLPALQQAYSAYSSIKGSSVMFNDVLELLDQPLPHYAQQSPSKPISFNQDIRLKNIDFHYNDQVPYILKKIDLTIAKGDRIGFIGKTGSGKSTLVDIIMGLLLPTKGEIYIDNQQITDKNRRSWQAHIAHVSQNIYLADASIEENIAFAVLPENIDHQRVRQAAKQAQISELIEQWPNKYQTFVGERGIRLSGGQRQRIGIARALYKRTDVLIFDEATSALDNETEQAVMEAIDGLDKELTILIIAHRLNTLKGCDKIVEIVDHTVK